MGIKYLYDNLSLLKLIKQTNINIESKHIYIDLDCIFYTYAHVSESDNELFNKIINILQTYIDNDNDLTVFYDSGLINKKFNQNNKRSISSQKYYNNIKDIFKKKYNMNDLYEIECKKIINNISTQTAYTCNNNLYIITELDVYDNNDDTNKFTQTEYNFNYDEYITCDDSVQLYQDVSIDIIKNPYTVIEDKKKLYSMQFNLDKDKKIKLKLELLEYIKNMGIKLITKSGIDAELYMIYKCIKIHNKYNIWPLCSSKDQDIIALTIINIPYNKFNIIYDNKIYLIKKNPLSIALVILSLVFNESDYFGGIYGYSFNGDKIEKLIDIIEFDNFDNILDYFDLNYIKKLCKNIIIKTISDKTLKHILNINMPIHDERIEQYLSEISIYLSCNKKFYDTNYNHLIDKNEFIRYLFYKDF
ncbi:FEN1-like nuclease (Cop-G5R) [Choristoneura rosaceana entomopoxvirus 'L']|uniref:FEN1-like nuclease (Cop-G5R) n=1 Tax=Choristoneura rosaceana entomopoxvirus 'L' TaxID=1293539 RepID=A0ABM9QKM8_9POXV|nr:FEN1-like nuclease (Cop-G5R) [Choristoneura rosaceana entomopoxvirus 'L']CCU56088.1 FEN1-like nuclease (Cop-G5R) [Choristoneura rosaceana entomopoxvirus 'L']